ncbi:hypothetical protein KBD75_00935 [Candidatus Woesebacteria bacterium]|nr:hypothetical protein [Candidatus Woesebacteria bacterium]
MKKSLFSIFNILVLLFHATPVIAVSTPSFPSCANPQGNVKVSYTDGTHGIVGSGATYTGRDTVYTLSDDTVTQCFCGADGNGIQTNWWKASSLTEDQVNILKSEGWVYIPAGNLWGLAEAPYLAKNYTYSCLPGSVNGSSTSQDNGTGGAYDEGDVLGLAATGDSILVYGSAILGLILVIIGIRRFKQA